MAGLVSHEDPVVASIGTAIRETLAGELPHAEKDAIARIEQRRTALLESDGRITVVDFGAGRPDSRRSREEMERGVQSTAQVSRITAVSKPPFWALLLYKLVRRLEPVSCLELGTCVGISAAYQATALRFNGTGTMTSLEGAPEIAAIAAETFEVTGCTNASVVTGPFRDTLGSALEKARPVDFFFNDGHHDHDAVLQYFEQAMPFLAETAVIVFDDIAWSEGMKRAWKELEADSRVTVSIDLGAIGIVLVRRGAAAKGRFRIPL